MPLTHILKNKKNIQTILNMIEFPILYIVDDFVKEINLVAKKLLQFDAQKDFEVKFHQFCKVNNYSLIELVDNGNQVFNSHEETYFVENKRFVILWNIIKFSDISDDLDGYLIFGSHLSKERSAIENLKKTESFYNNILSKLPTNVYWKDKNCVYMGCNDRLANVMGLSSRDAIKGMTDFDFYWGVEGAAKKFVEFDKKVMFSKEPLTTEDTFREASGNLVTVLTNKTPLEDEQGKVVGVLAISVDITDRKKMEEELRQSKEKAEVASRVKSAFIANMSHDIRGPLTGIIGMATMLEEGAHNGLEKEQAHNLLVCGEQLSDLLTSVLDIVSSEDVTEKSINKKTFDLRKLIQDLYDIYLLNAQNKQLNLKLEVDSLVPPFVISDRLKLYRVLFNLLGNAIKFTEKGEVIIQVKKLRNVDKQVLLEFRVSDTGIGISDDFQDKVFDRFSRETPSYKGIYKGYGLGLHMAQNYVTALGSKINLDSQKGKGSTFSFELMMEVGTAEDVKAHELIKLDIPSDNKLLIKERSENLVKHETVLTSNSSSAVLIVEDDRIAMQFTKRVVNEAGYSVITASSGEAALEIAKKGNCRIILTDLGLPGISGDELTLLVRHSEKVSNKQPIPIIALTGHGSDPEVIKSCLDAGMNEVIGKPINFAVIENILKKFIPSHFVAKTPDNSSVASVTALTELGFELSETEEKLFQLEYYSLFDLQVGIKSMGTASAVKDLLPSLIEQSIVEAGISLKKAYKANDWEAVRKITHRIKSGAFSIGAMKMGYACQYLEKYYMAGYRSQLEKLYQQLLKVLVETKQCIENFLDKQEK